MYLSPLCSPCSGHYKAIVSANLKLSDSRTQVCGQLDLILWIIDSVKARNTLVHNASAWQCLYSRLVILEGPEFNFTAVQKLFQKSKSCSRPSLFHILNSPYTKDHLLGLIMQTKILIEGWEKKLFVLFIDVELKNKQWQKQATS